jgi:hypothetical protein
VTGVLSRQSVAVTWLWHGAGMHTREYVRYLLRVLGGARLRQEMG